MAEQFKYVELVNTAEEATIVLDGSSGIVQGHKLVVENPAQKGMISLGIPWKAEENPFFQPLGVITPNTKPDEPQFANDLVIKNKNNDDVLVFIEKDVCLSIGGIKKGGCIIVRNDEKKPNVIINDGGIQLYDENGSRVFEFDIKKASLSLGYFGNNGELNIRDHKGNMALKFNGEKAILRIGAKENGGDFIVRDSNNRSVLYFSSGASTLYVGNEGKNGRISLKDNSGSERILLDGQTGDIRLSGGDCAEYFDTAETEVKPGSVLVLDDLGKLKPCERPYDRRVAGIVSGAGDMNPGLMLNGIPTGERRVPVALSGKVYCKASAVYSPISVGDLLTTSNTPGHAMKAVDPSQAFGAVLGKAMASLKEDLGLIPVLVALQ